ncbi:MAG: hypothetical protein KGN32_02215 [Burkholderiales bacterium]|nr:hypothetical protein [Burkholderiales bacterium]
MFFARAQWFLLMLAASGECGVWAQSQDVVKLRGNLSILNNDNFFSAPVGAVSERITSQTIGVNVAVPYSLQRFEFDASLVGTQHQTYTNFDFVAQNYNAAWLWSVTPQLHGSLSTVRTESLNATADSLNSNLRNKNITDNAALSAIFELGGPWQVTAGVANNSSTNEQALTNQSDNRSTGVIGGVRYSVGSGSSLAYSLQRASGTSINDYTSTTHDVAVAWVLSGNSTVNGHIAYLEQHFGVVPQFDFSGTSGALTLVWRATGRVSVSAGWQRDLASYQTAGTTHTQTDAFTLAPAWQITTKTSLRLQYREAVRDDRGNPTGVPASRQDRTRDTSLSLSWQPRPAATLAVTIGENSRSSNVVNTDFIAHTAGLSAVFTF